MTLPEICLHIISDHEIKNAFLLNAHRNMKCIILSLCSKKLAPNTSPSPLKFNTSLYYATTDPADTAVTVVISGERWLILKYLVLL